MDAATFTLDVLMAENGAAKSECLPLDLSDIANSRTSRNQPMTTTDPKLIDCPQISMGHGKVDVGIILHEGRKGLIFHPRESYIPVGAPGETAGDYWPQPEDVIIWIDAPEGADVIVWEIAPLATAPTAAAINEAAHQWQDIATAPRDGTAILITRDTRFQSEEGWHVVRWDDDWWQVHCGKFDHPLRGPDPTHWMPLPSPPAIEAKESGHG